MDGIHHEEEIDSSEQVNVAEISATRSYDCMYCKRGFSTAQALGGHMNIHRRDRARFRDNVAPPSSTPVFTAGNVHAAEEEFGHSGYSFGSSSHKDLKPLFPLVSEPWRAHPFQSSCTTSPTKEERRHGKDDVDPKKMQELIRYGKELGLGCKHVDVEQEQKERQGEKGNLDLHLGL